MSLKLKRNYPILLLLALTLGVLSLGLGGQRVIAYTSPTSASSEATSGQGVQIGGTIDLFDESTVHTIEIRMDDSAYEQMIATYQQTGEKDYLRADVIVDGVEIRDVGIRLKGNASLHTALGRASRPGAGEIPFLPEGLAPGGQMPGEFNPAEQAGQGFQRPPRQGVPGDGPGGADRLPGGMPPATNLAAGETKIPLLIKFNEFVAGQTYQGYTRLALRTYGATYDEAMLAEPVTNAVFKLAGLPAPRTAYSSVQVNEQSRLLYVISKVVDDPIYLERHFANPNGILYKAEVGSSLKFINEDPSSYARSFSQETRQNEADLAPLIRFMRFLSEADDAEFETRLAEYLDIDSFAAYLAVNTLLVNNDSLVGMNNNYYLYHDDSSGRFTLLYWDGNESLGGLGRADSANSGLYFENARGVGRMGSEQSILLTRFMASETFKALYEARLVQVYEQAFLSGAIVAKINAAAALIEQANARAALVDLERYQAAVAETRSFIAQRAAYLATTSLLGK